jgi:PAS domain S-box-containing protein
LEHSARELQKAKEVIDFRHAEIMKLIAAITSILIAVDSKGKIYQWNGPAEAFFDLSREECLGLSLEEVLTEYLEAAEWQQFNGAALHPGAGVAVQELNFRFNGRQALLQVTVNPIMDKNETPRGFLLLGEDITNRKAEEAERNLVLKLKAVGEMVTGILHEINTPVQYISINAAIVSRSLTELDRLFKELAGCLDAMESGSADDCAEAVRQLLEEKKVEPLFKQAFNAAGMINDGVARVMSASKTMKAFFHPGQEEMEMYDINKLIRSTLMVSQYKLKEAAGIHIQLAPGQLLTYCYPAELNLAFLNLILNALDAVKATGKRGKITVCSLLKEEMIHVDIADTGLGIPLEVQDKVFNPFFTTKGIGKGTGQGLAIALRVIQQQHGGQLYFDSDGQNGTTFHIHLPVHRVLPPACSRLLTGPKIKSLL